MRTIARAGVCLAICAVAGTSAATGAVAHSAGRPSLKPLKVSIHLDKARYASHAKAHITITLKNTGSHKLRPIGAACNRAGDPDQVANIGRNWGHLAASGAGVTIAAHHSRTFHVTAKLPSSAQRLGQVVVACDFGYRHVETGYRPLAQDMARVPGQFGVLKGTVQYFASGKSGKATGLKGVRAVLIDPTNCPLRKRTATTNSKGQFTIKRAPAGKTYKLYFVLPHGWKMRNAHSNPTPALVVGKETSRVGVFVKRGTPAHRPKLPTKCHP